MNIIHNSKQDEHLHVPVPLEKTANGTTTDLQTLAPAEVWCGDPRYMREEDVAFFRLDG